MKYLKSFGISFFIGILLIIVLTFLTTLLNYFDIISSKTMSIIKIIIPLFCLFVSGFYLGKKANKRGFVEGIKIALFFIVFLIIINLILKQNFNVKDLIYYLLILISSIFGSMVGINRKKE